MRNKSTSSLVVFHTYFSSSFIPNLSSSDAENYILEWLLVSGVVVFIVAAGLIVNAKGRLLQGEMPKEETITGVRIQLGLIMGPASTDIVQSAEYEEPENRRIELTDYAEPVDVLIGSESNNTAQRDSTDVREYEEPQSSRNQLAAYIEPTDNGSEDREAGNGAIWFHVYEKLHPYQNQGNNMYSCFRCESTIEDSIPD
ncbi:hypothetical protein CHS0354_020861 [Potamilus streckersoni]|uniref:Uncharacterized protein n=1 Tax=Potamilus streckersoni TaxID=2493646 RepID=A0AAE0SFS7_9BIVA|nr:hypothetical protein CHS0354_020861 [Potamilus streckersoni]